MYAIRSYYDKEKELTNFFSMLMVVNGLGPIAAPVFGGVTIKFTNWQGIFLILLALGIVITSYSIHYTKLYDPFLSRNR